VLVAAIALRRRDTRRESRSRRRRPIRWDRSFRRGL